VKGKRFSVEQIVSVLKQLQDENARLKKLVAEANDLPSYEVWRAREYL
jgi:hypothetical protein